MITEARAVLGQSRAIREVTKREMARLAGNLEAIRQLAVTLGHKDVHLEMAPVLIAPTSLSPREVEIMTHIKKATPLKEIAILLKLTPGSLSQRLARLYKKVNVHSARELALYGWEEEGKNVTKSPPIELRV